MSPRELLITLGGLLLLVVTVHDGRAQDRPDTTATDTAAVDTTVPPTARDRPSADSADAQRAPSASNPTSDTTSGASSASGETNGDAAEDAVTFSARDSMVIRTSPSGDDHGTLHGEAHMSYRDASLKARTIDMDFQSSTLRAEGAPADTVQGNRALFERSGGMGRGSAGDGSDGTQSFTGDVLSYNLNNRRGRVVAARTQRQDGYVEGSAVKMFEDSTLFVQNGTYTTCNCPAGQTPSYSLRSDEMKLDNRWVYTGPIQLYLFNVPTPLWLPFGFLPNVEGRRSGPLAPEYGEDRRGFFLKDWGWYFALNAYTDLTLQASVWSQGSFEVRPRFRYNKRYGYNGDLRLTYRRERIGEEEDPNFQNQHEGRLRWTHNQDFSPTARLNGNVDLSTSSDFSRRDSDSFDDAVRQEASSSVRYEKRWPGGGRSLTLSAEQTQEFQSGEVDLTLPNLNFTQNNFNPLELDQGVGDKRWFEKITTRYNLSVQNDYRFDPRDPQTLRQNQTPADSALADSVERADIDWYEALVDPNKYELATGNDNPYNVQATHNVPLDATFRVDRYNLSLTPNITYNSNWRLSTTRKTARRDSTGGVADVVERTEPGFYARHDFETSLSASSEIFGTFPLGLGPFQGLRHRLSPNLSMNYRPNFNRPFWGRTRTLRFPDGTPVVADSATGEVRRYDILGGNRVRGSNRRLNLRLNLSNVFETKRLRSDTTSAQSEEKITLLNLDVSNLAYDFARDSLQVGDPVSVRARTSIDPFEIRLQSDFSPYALRRTSSASRQEFRRVDRLMVVESPLTPVRLTRFRANVSANFSSDDAVSAPRLDQSEPSNSASSPPPSQSTTELSALSIPWSLGFDFNYRLQKPRKDVTNRTATLSVNFDVNVTPLWRVGGQTGYDFMQEEISTTRLSVERALGCWDMSFNWVPFGRFQKYGFQLQVSSGHLSDLLKLPVPNSGGEGRFGGLGDQFKGAAQNASGSNF